MSVQSEPEKYSIDEMMERLKKRPDEDPAAQGELVTRSDGSQAIRVRKRKRRSHQPHKEQLRVARRARMIQISGALILLLLALLVAGGGVIYANSAPFREALVRKTAAASGAAAEIRQFRMNPTSANSSLVILQWPAGNPLRELSARNLRADIHPISFLGKALSGEEIKTPEATLFVNFPDLDQPAREDAGADARDAIRFQRYAAGRLSVILGDPAAPLLRVFDTDASFQPDSLKGRPLLLLNGGHAVIPGRPKLRIDRAHIEFRDNEVDILGLRLRDDEDTRGKLELAGTVAPFSPERAATLAVLLEAFPLSGLVGPELGRILSGRVDSVPESEENRFSFRAGSRFEASLGVEFSGAVGDEIAVTGLPVLKTLALLLEDRWFERPVFQTRATGRLRRENGGVTLTDLHLENKDRLCLRGALARAADGSLAGTLEVGVAESMITAAANRRLSSVFARSSDGFLWTRIEITGRAEEPADDFRVTYEATLTPEREPTGRVPSFEDLTQPGN